MNSSRRSKSGRQVSEVTENGVEQAWDSSMGGGFFADAGVEVAAIADDPFGFGNVHHIIAVSEFRNPELSKSGSGKFGSYVTFEILEDRYSKLRPFGIWFQIPTPKAIQAATGISFDPNNNPDDQRVAFTFKRLLWAFGFNADQMNSANPANIQGRPFLSKLYAKEEDGFFKPMFSIGNVKRMPEPGTDEYNALMAPKTDDPLSEFATGNSSGGGMSAAEKALAEEIANS